MNAVHSEQIRNNQLVQDKSRLTIRNLKIGFQSLSNSSQSMWSVRAPFGDQAGTMRAMLRIFSEILMAIQIDERRSP